MKTYIVYVNGTEQNGYIKAKSHNDAERKAKAYYPNQNVTVVYTEI
jgi:hypothetical protein